MRHSITVDSEAMSDVGGVETTEMLGLGDTVLSDVDIEKVADAVLAKIESRAFECCQRSCVVQRHQAGLRGQPGRGVPQPETEPLDLIWGVAAIAKFIGRTVRQTETALAKKELPARTVNGRWVASRKKLVEHFEGAGA